MHKLLKAFIEAFTGRSITATRSASRVPAAALNDPAKPGEFTQGQFDELCSVFGIPANMELLVQKKMQDDARGVNSGG